MPVGLKTKRREVASDMRHIILTAVVLAALGSPLMAQNAPKTAALKVAPTAVSQSHTADSEKPGQQQQRTKTSQQKTMVYLEHAETFSFDEAVNSEVQLLKGNVRFRHDDVFLFCDSAYFFDKKNSFNAYGHVKIVQGDTLFIYSDVLYYDGDTKMARLRHNVRMTNRDVTLLTDSLNYDRIANVGYYYTGGRLFDTENELTSIYGYYYPGVEMALFRSEVLLINPGFTMRADTLKYYTQTAITEMLGPTTILYENETTIYSELGQYDTHTEQSQLLRNSWVKHIDGQTLIGDTIFYDKQNGEGRAYSHVQLNDSAKQLSLYGNFVYYKEKGDIALAYDSALMVEHSSPDTLYLNADTLYAYAVDSTDKVVRAFHHVRIFRHDVQAVCDSASFETRDSVIHLMQLPVAWSGTRQITGDTMHIYSLNGEPDRLHVVGAAFVCERQDSNYYNQLSGKELIAHIADSELRMVEVRGNAESRYFPLDDDSLLIGLNQTTSSYLTVYLKNQKIERIVLYPSPEGVLTPINQTTEEMLRLPGFSWQESIRPLCWQDVFARPERPKNETAKKYRRPGHVESAENESATDSEDNKPQNRSNDPTRYDSFSGTTQTISSAAGGGKTTLKKQGGK